MSEHDEQTKLFQILRLYEDKYPMLKSIFAIPNGGYRHISVAKRMKAEGVKAGVWDLMACIPVGNFAGMFVEMKYGKNKLTKSQQEFRYGLRGYYKFEVCYSAIEACHAIGEYLDIRELKEIE